MRLVFGRCWARAIVAGLLLGGVALGQRLENRPYEDAAHGFQLRLLHEWEPIPVPVDRVERGLLLLQQAPARKPEGGRMAIFFLRDKEVAEGRPASTSGARKDVAELIPYEFPVGRKMEDAELLEDEQEEIDGLLARRRLWEVGELWVEAWTLYRRDHDVALVYSVSIEDNKSTRWRRSFAKSAGSFEGIERVEGLSLEEAEGYEDILEFHRQDAERTPGWRVVPTPTEQFVIKTSHEDEDFVEEVIERLEQSRALFERDFPPKKPIEDVSVVRLCTTPDEFHKYGKTGGGVAGWFNPQTIELVLYDAKNINRAQTFAVMSHEAFHQYCHFLFEESEAHRWFDEGHGDYYGAAEFRGRRVEIETRMPGGLNRLDGIREMVRSETYAPLREHLYFDHMQWQTQGPRNTSCYEQSWSIVYMLRSGMLGDVSRRVWKEEYAEILPNYIETLHSGFRESYDEIRAEREAKAKREGRELSEAEQRVSSVELFMHDPERKQKIWDAAMEASWGRIDLDEFEENWKLYVEKYL